ncbi:serine/threonine protein kinase [Amycolatopsis mediterranei S699]|uniref:non-specific serine/threonine protein kinase n=2 Tax=Amycolatopsis mediterranei TaxID=33910 RepID=A0A0H3CV21_AMYMU|nr:Stk1 family PASTA domain-containing Ser/Thr kinase [Amycolatopsis mediterranei]ADJ41875.1 serine/threonine protein kinase [Amycolatopsis mediterranei U32]AEK38546.1 serine/threonine protein kinase [Amycolatopsis mediterranei S699]AFO73585.1 serine/threonine protein kinase [Amycolatopsis mediterranei S699]AGT80714.1 serine/threonine protein kinase [Amycolatopsis mediterranei RB]KDO09021.1 serine/threonine protein kinase [Amycolatopsis mediterranei]
MSTPRLLSNRYELGETLGYGGMSEVHHGHDVRLGREVAIKILRADLARDPQFLERFRREAQNAAALNHPAIVAVYDTGEANAEFGPLPYIVMEYVEGRTLRDIVKTEGPMSQKRAMEVMADVCAALDFSHRHGIVHRDVKPANVMITKNGAVKVMDFGIARAMHDGQSAMTQTAAVIGTAQYLSPEQARGESVDARSDVYAAGCVLYELITGEPPFTGDSPVAVAYQHVREDPSAPSSVNPAVAPELDAVVLKALAKGPANRYQSAAEMRSDLVRTLSGQRPVAPMVMSEDERTQVMNADRRQPQRYDEYSEPDDEDPKAKRRRRAILAAVAAVFVLGAVLLIMWLSNAFKSNDPTTVAVPDVLHQTVPQARETLISKGFTGTVEQKQVTCGVQPTDGNPQCGQDDVNRVIKIDPGVGTQVASTQKMTLYVGVAPGKSSVPDLKGKTRDQAEQALTDAKLTLDGSVQETEVSDPNQAGLVLAQNPPSGSQVDQGTSVKITIGKSKQLKTVTDFTNQAYSKAKSSLESQGFTTKRVDQASETVPKDTVITQNPNGGQLAVGSQIVLTVSTGPDSSSQIQMPLLAGMTLDQAQDKLSSMGWTGKFNQKSDKNSNAPEGTITGQNPSAGTMINRDQNVTVNVSEGNGFPSITFPTTTRTSN